MLLPASYSCPRRGRFICRVASSTVNLGLADVAHSFCDLVVETCLEAQIPEAPSSPSEHSRAQAHNICSVQTSSLCFVQDLLDLHRSTNLLACDIP